MNGRGDVLLVVGHAKFPSDTTAKHVYNNLSIGLLLDRKSGEVLEVSSTLLPPYGNEMLRQIMLGKRVPEDLKSVTQEIHLRYVCRTRNTILAALGDVVRRLREQKKGGGEEER